MAYRNGTYIAFHANGTTEPGESDYTYYNLLKAWHVRDESDFEFVNSHEKTSALRDGYSKQALRERLVTRLRNSKHMLLIIGDTTHEDRDWVPFEIEYAIDKCDLPIIAVYTGYKSILNPASHSARWPKVLRDRINSKSARVLHIPFKEKPIIAAVKQFSIHDGMPKSALSHYSREAYMNWDLI